MRAVHSIWTKPFFARGGKSYLMEDFDLLTTALSALVWRRNGGSISLLTDDAGAEYFSEAGLEALWDGGISTPLSSLPPEIDPYLFWAAGKLWALRSCREPVCLVDCDMIVWREPKNELNGAEIAVAHREALNPDIYPPKDFFRMKAGYAFPDWDWSVSPCNTAFLYIKDMDFKNYYTDRSFEFMTSLGECGDAVIPMVFAEQRLLAMCAAEKGKPITHLLDQYHLREQSMITHVWGHKSRMRANRDERSAFCRRCVERVRRDFPEWEPRLAAVPELIGHFLEP